MAHGIGMTTKPLDTSTRLAVDRTRLAHERTLMAWVRTATSMISFGFSIYKFFQTRDGQPDSGLIGPREFAILMIGIGLTALLLATIEHRRTLRAMRAEYGAVVPYSLATLIGGLVSVLGVLGLVMALLRQ